jgi:hypothetical protein
MLAPERHDNVKDNGEQPPSPRKPYSRPTLVVHGRIEEITAAAGSTNSDGVVGSQLV